MNVPRYRIQAAVSPNGLGPVTLWPVRQIWKNSATGVETSRILGYFCSKEDADSFVSMATYLESQAATATGERRV